MQGERGAGLGRGASAGPREAGRGGGRGGGTRVREEEGPRGGAAGVAWTGPRAGIPRAALGPGAWRAVSGAASCAPHVGAAEPG